MVGDGWTTVVTVKREELTKEDVTTEVGVASTETGVVESCVENLLVEIDGLYTGRRRII